jgi:hypothetical protein
VKVSSLRHAVVGVLIGVCLLAAGAVSLVEEETQTEHNRPMEAIICEPNLVDSQHIAAWKSEGYETVILVLDERFEAAVYRKAVSAIAAASLDLYYWIEVGRNPTLAREHPEWIAALGMHDDWRVNFSDAPELADRHVAKAWPWVPIAYRDAFHAHLARIKALLDRVPGEYRGLLLNDLQGAPSSCGCGNLQCRWAIDYGVPATTPKLDAPDVAARFLAEARKLVENKQLIPVWTTECEQHDLAREKSAADFSTGYCGNVDCFDNCRDRFAEQWNALHKSQEGPIGILALHKELHRDRSDYGQPANWIARAVEYLDQLKPKRLPHNRLWLVVQGYGTTPSEESAARDTAKRTGAGAVLVAKARIDQSYEPRIIPAPTK